MKLTAEEVRQRLDAAPGYDGCVLRIEDGDFGCEEMPDPPHLWLLVQLRDGSQRSFDLSERRVNALGLTEGGVCRLSDLHA